MSPTAPPDWYLKEWMRHFGKRQAALSNELGWTKGRAHGVWHGAFPYRREVVNELAKWLGVEPFELLMAPKDALALRMLRETAVQIADDQRARSLPNTPQATKTRRAS